MRLIICNIRKKVWKQEENKNVNAKIWKFNFKNLQHA